MFGTQAQLKLKVTESGPYKFRPYLFLTITYVVCFLSQFPDQSEGARFHFRQFCWELCEQIRANRRRKRNAEIKEPYLH